MNSKKFSNQDLINATFEIYEKFNTQNGIKKNGKIKNNNSKPLLLSKEVRPQKKIIKKKLSKKTTDHEKISNAQRLKAYALKKNKILGFVLLSSIFFLVPNLFNSLDGVLFPITYMLYIIYIGYEFGTGYFKKWKNSEEL